MGEPSEYARVRVSRELSLIRVFPKDIIFGFEEFSRVLLDAILHGFHGKRCR